LQDLYQDVFNFEVLQTGIIILRVGLTNGIPAKFPKFS
jgi:hypothetical protein